MHRHIAFIGLGKLGLPIAEAMAEKFQVRGFDIAPRNGAKVEISSDLATCVKHADLIFIAVPTPHHPDYDGRAPTSHLPPRDFDYQQVKDVLRGIEPHLESDQVVVLISTVLPGTLRRELAPLISKAPLIYNPYLIAMGSEVEDFLNPEMLIIGSESGQENYAVKRLNLFYDNLILPGCRRVMGSWEEAEAIKIFYNTFISTKLSLVNMIQDVCMRLGNANVDLITQALAESGKRILSPMYMRAGLGDGGPCHPRDNIALRWLAKELDLGYDLFGAIMQAREAQAKNMARFIYAQGTHIVLLGEAFKPAVAYQDGSFSLLLKNELKLLGAEVYGLDPKLNRDERPNFETLERLAKAGRLVYFVSFWEPWIDQLKFAAGAKVIDPWRTGRKIPGLEIIQFGNSRSESKPVAASSSDFRARHEISTFN